MRSLNFLVIRLTKRRSVAIYFWVLGFIWAFICQAAWNSHRSTIQNITAMFQKPPQPAQSPTFTFYDVLTETPREKLHSPAEGSWVLISDNQEVAQFDACTTLILTNKLGSSIAIDAGICIQGFTFGLKD